MFKKHVEIGQHLWFSIWMGNMKVLPTTSYLVSLHVWVVDSTVDGLDHLKLGSSVPNIIKTSKKWSKIKNGPKYHLKIVQKRSKRSSKHTRMPVCSQTPSITFPARIHGHPPSVWHRHGSAEQRHFLTSMTLKMVDFHALSVWKNMGKNHGKIMMMVIIDGDFS